MIAVGQIRQAFFSRVSHSQQKALLPIVSELLSLELHVALLETVLFVQNENRFTVVQLLVLCKLS